MKKDFRGISMPITFFIVITLIIVAILMNNRNNEDDYKHHYNRINDLYSKIDSKTINFESEIFNRINKENNSLILAEYYDALTRYYILNNNFQFAKTYSEKAMNEYSKMKDGNNYILNAFKNASILDIWELSSNNALSYHYRMIEISQKKEVMKDSKFTKEEIEGLSYAMLTIFYGKSNNFNKTKEYFDLLNKVDWQNIHDKEIRYIIMHAKGLYNVTWGDRKKAEEDMIALSRQLDDESMNLMYIKPVVYLNTSITQIYNGKVQNALTGVDKTVKLNNNRKNKILLECYITYGFYYEMQGFFEEAKINYEKALALSEELGSNIGAIRSLGALIVLCDKFKQTTNNEAYYKKFWQLSRAQDNNEGEYIVSIISLNDQLNNERFSIIENEKKSEIEKRKFTKLALIIAVIALVILSFGTRKLYNEIKLRKESEKKLKATIDEDYLTKAYTRGYAYQKLKPMIAEKASIYLAMVDLDDYKKINDVFGHSIGDRVLVNFVEICNSFLRDEDFIARFGGEEFIIILKDKSKEEAIGVIESIRKSLENKEWCINGLKVTASIGVVYNTYEDVDMLVKKADDLLYEAKKSGKNRVEFE